MSSVCLSLVANLRCTGLRPQQTIGILVPPIVELVAIFPLIYSQREQGRSHYLLISESFFYLILCILDFVSKSTDSIAKSLDTFSVVDRLIGGFSAIPILLYTIFLYVLARRFFIPVIPKRFHSGVKVLLLVLIPTILALIEFGSLIGITYTVVEKPTRELAVRFESTLAKTVWTLFGSAGLAIFILYQFITFLLASFRTFRHFIQNSSSTFAITRSEREKVERGRSLRGLGWLLAGIKLGAIEVLIGYIPNGFEQSLSRRLLRLLARAMLAWGVYKGLDESASLTMFRVGSIDSFESLPPRKIPVNPESIRPRIGAPLADTFAKMSPTATSFHTRKNAPNAMKGISAFDVSFVDEKGVGSSRSPPGPSGLRYAANAATLPTTIVPAMVAQSLVSPITSKATFPKQTATPPPPGLQTRSRSSPGLDAKRVTVTYDGRAAPILDVRFSAQLLGNASQLIKRVGQESSASSVESSGEEKTTRPALSRSKSSPSIATAAHSKNSPAKTLPPLVKMAASSTSDLLMPAMVRTTASKPTSRSRSRSLSAKSTTPTSELRNPFADSYEILLPSSQESGILRPRQEGLGSSDSTDDSLVAVHRLSRKFPPIPANAMTVPMPQAESPSDESPLRSSSRRKPPPSLTSLTTGGNNKSSKLTKQGGRPRSLSQPNAAAPQHRNFMPEMVETPKRQHAAGELSPATSLDQDVAMRTRRRVRNYLNNVSPRTSVADGDSANPGEQWVALPPQPPFSGKKGHRHSKSLGSLANRTATTANTPITPFSGGPPMTSGSRAETKATSIMSPGTGRFRKEEMASPSTVYTRESVYTTDEEDGAYTASLPVERPLGRIARRALGIEQFLDEERERSQDGHSDVQMHVRRPENVPVDVEDIPEYRASNIVFTPPSTMRRRPRSDIDPAFGSIPLPSKSSRKQRERKQNAIMEEPEAPLQRSLTTVEDPETRKAFALAWKHAAPNANVASPKAAAGLKTVNSVSAKTTPTPVHRKVLSGQSMRVDEGHVESLDVLVTSPLPISPSPMAGFGRMRGSTFIVANNDRELVKQSRKAHVMSVDSDVY